MIHEPQTPDPASEQSQMNSQRSLRHQTAISGAHHALDHAASPADCPHRPVFHTAAPAGWMNDPNGLIHFRGEFHLFYQHHPYSNDWGPMHWGHLASRDLVRWRHLPIALAPSEPYDRAQKGGGCYSGSAVDDDGVLTLIYTGHVDGAAQMEVQCVATSRDGVAFTKDPANPVIARPPVDGSADFRDPKVWRHGDHWYLVAGSCQGGRGNVLIFRSGDLRDWQYLGKGTESDGTQAAMWECPDLFPLGGVDALIVSLSLERTKTVVMTGAFDHATGRFDRRSWRDLDAGPDFYAAQTLLDPRGRRIVIGWMDSWKSTFPTKPRGWAGAMSIPRVLTLADDGQVLMSPLPELSALRGDPWSHGPQPIAGDHALDAPGGSCLELIADFDLAASTATSFGLRVRASASGDEQTVIRFDRATARLTVDLDRSGCGPRGIFGGEVSGVDRTLRLHLFIDRSSLELFANDGRLAITSRIYPAAASTSLSLFADGGTARLTRLDAWPLTSIWGT
ncbi:MAG: glycoside hydrolase family 32 protein [Planctomycetes bacterium]|nr:glycoside hydrolase family 32 protein [Planctomycetota bacterium]